MKSSLAALALTATLLAPALHAQSPAPRSDWPTLNLSAEASRQAPNDLGRATLFVEITDATPAEVARRVNQRVNEVLSVARGYRTVKSASGGVQTYPLYGRTPGRIENWRMRSEVSLESRDIPALAELLGKLQSLAATEQFLLLPAPETRQKAADEAMVDALKSFQARAALAAQALGKRYRVKDVAVAAPGERPPIYFRGRMAMAEAAAAPAPAPVEAGESAVTVTVSGTVELLD